MAESPKIKTENEELLSPRDFQREFGAKLKELQAGKVEKLVLLRHSQMVGVVLDIDTYAALLKRAYPGE